MSTIHQLDPNTAKNWLDNNEAVLFDVREVSEYQTESIPSATNKPLSTITLDDLKSANNKKIIIHCQAGKRSLMACEKLKKAGFNRDLWNLDGGINSWKLADFPTKKGDKKVLPINQQVQVSIGSLSLIGIILGVAVSPYWLLLSVITSAGLINSGLTGWCGLAKIIAKMPWNR